MTLYVFPLGRYALPSCGSNTALDPVSKFAELPSAFNILVASCVVITTVSFADAHAFASSSLVRSRRAFRVEIGRPAEV